jgi:hypothetical protein
MLPLHRLEQRVPIEAIPTIQYHRIASWKDDAYSWSEMLEA